MRSFFDSCVEAGSEKCAFYGPTAHIISKRLDVLYDSIRARPVPVYSDSGYGVVDYVMLRASIFQALYKPYAVFPRLAQALADLEGGNGTGIFTLVNSNKRFECHCDSSDGSFEVVSDASAAIACTDGKEVRDSVQEFEIFYNEMRNISEWADVWTGLRMRCSYVDNSFLLNTPICNYVSQRLAETKEEPLPRFSENSRSTPCHHKSTNCIYLGPFVGNTSFPILVIGNTAGTPCGCAQ